MLATRSEFRWLPLAAMVALIAAALFGPTAGAVEFHDSIDAAREKAKQPDLPVVVNFGADWCVWCRKMETETFSDEKVQAIAEKFLWVKIDIDKQKEMAARYRAAGVPHTVILNGKGQIIGMHSGYMPADKFLAFLEKTLANPQPQDIPESVAGRLAGAKTGKDRREAILAVVELLAKPDRQARREMLAAVAGAGPVAYPVLLELMADRRLSVRAAAGAALKHAAGADLPFGPFAAKQKREQQLAAWQTWVTAHKAPKTTTDGEEAE